MKASAICLLSLVLFCSFVFQTGECGSIPALNKKIAAYAKSKIGKKDGDYCNDFLKRSYKAAGLEFYTLAWGEPIDHSKDCVFPGDVLVLRNVEVSWKRNDSIVGYKFDTMIEYVIIKVRSKGAYTVAHTETLNGKMKVCATELEINKFKGEKPKVYRPTKK